MTSLDTRPRAATAPQMGGSRTDPRAGSPAGADEVAQSLARFFDGHERLAARHGPTFSALWAQMRRAAEGGKKFRPDLVTVAHRELGGENPEAALATATAFELLHTAFLLHDDVIDGDTVRRGRANLIGAWSGAARSNGLAAGAVAADGAVGVVGAVRVVADGATGAVAGTSADGTTGAAEGWGQAAGILAGDLLLHGAQGLLARMDITVTLREAVLDTFDDAVATTASGELDDVGLSMGAEPASMAVVLSMTARKTARYSFQAPLRAGALLAGAPDATLTALERYGHHAGMAFQLRDDLLGVFGDAAATGKSTSSDLRRATMTPLVAYALQTPYAGELLGLLRAGCESPGAEDRARRVMIDAGARDFVEHLVADHVAKALKAARSRGMPTSLGDYLVSVAQAAGQRAW